MNKNTIDKNILRSLIYKKFNSKQELIGVVTIVLYSKEIFPKNSDAHIFINEVFNISYLDYVVRSRTLLCARLSRSLVAMDENTLEKVAKKLSTFFSINYSISKENQEVNTKKGYKGNANQDVDKWIQGLLGKNKNDTK